MAEWIRTIVELLLTGGLIVTLVTLRSTRRKANAEADGVEKDNREKDMNLGEQYVNAFMKNIVDPLKSEMVELRQRVVTLTDEVKELKDAVQKANTCPHAAECPVLWRLQKHQAHGAHRAQHVVVPRNRDDPGGRSRGVRGGDDVERHDADSEPGGRHDDDRQQRPTDDAEKGQGQRQ